MKISLINQAVQSIKVTSFANFPEDFQKSFAEVKASGGLTLK